MPSQSLPTVVSRLSLQKGLCPGGLAVGFVANVCLHHEGTAVLSKPVHPFVVVAAHLELAVEEVATCAVRFSCDRACLPAAPWPARWRCHFDVHARLQGLVVRKAVHDHIVVTILQRHEVTGAHLIGFLLLLVFGTCEVMYMDTVIACQHEAGQTCRCA